MVRGARRIAFGRCWPRTLSVHLPPVTRREPYRILFPLGVLLAGAGVLPWGLFALGFTQAYRPIFHSVVFRSMFHPLAEVEGFLTCFAVGSIFTLVPQRTNTAPPARWQMAVALAAPVLIVISAALQWWVVGQIAWLVVIGVMIEFSIRRLRSRPASGARPVASVWISVGLLMGATGAAFAAVGEVWAKEWPWLHDLGRALLTQGLFSGLCLGAAGLLLSSPESGAKDERRLSTGWTYLVHAVGAALFLASFWIGQLGSARLGFALRAAVTLAVVLQLRRAPLLSNKEDGLARAVRIALWMLPIGNAWISLVPANRRAGLHVIYLGCFTLLVLVVSTYLCAGRARRPDSPVEASSLQVWLGAACLALALGTRVLVEMDPPNFKLWLGVACVCFVAATVFMFRSVSEWLSQLFEIESSRPYDHSPSQPPACEHRPPSVPEIGSRASSNPSTRQPPLQ